MTEVKSTLLAMSGQQKTITLHRPFVEFTGSLEGGLLLSQLLYWHNRGSDEWTAKTDDEFVEELCLTKYRLRKARGKMEEDGWLETEVRKFGGAPTLHYRLDLSELVKAWRSYLSKQIDPSPPDSNDTDRSSDIEKRKLRNQKNDLPRTQEPNTETTTENTAENTHRSSSLRSEGQSPPVPTLFTSTDEEPDPKPPEEPDVIEVEAEEESRARVEDFRAGGLASAAEAFAACENKQGENYLTAVVFRDLFAPGQEPRPFIGRLAKMRQMLVGEKVEGEKLDRAAAGRSLIAGMYHAASLEDFAWTDNTEAMKALPKRALNYVTKVISNRKEENTDAEHRQERRNDTFATLEQLGEELQQHAGAGAGAAK